MTIKTNIKETLLKIIIIFLVLLIVVTFISLVKSVYNEEENEPEPKIKRVPCYDKYNHEIEGITCKKEVYTMDEDAEEIFYIMLGVVGIFFMTIVLFVVANIALGDDV